MKKITISALCFAMLVSALYATNPDSTKTTNGTSGIVLQKDDEIAALKARIKAMEERMVLLDKKISDLEKNSKPRIVPAN